ncbi:MAG: hypothetical protein ABH839_00235 [Chloroflexota bacterium]
MSRRNFWMHIDRRPVLYNINRVVMFRRKEAAMSVCLMLTLPIG